MMTRWAVILLLVVISNLGGCNASVMSKDMNPKKHFEDEKVIALAKATVSGDVKTIDRLVSEGVDVNYRGRKNITPLLWSVGKPDKAGMRRLLEHGASPNILTDDGDSFIGFVAASPDTDYLKMALEYGGNPNLRNNLEETVLFSAATANHENVEESIRFLIEYGADINAVDYSGTNAAMAAAGINQFRSAFFLIKKGIDYKQKNQWGNSIVYVLERNRLGFFPGSEKYDFRTRIAAFLEERGIEVDLKTPPDAPENWLELSYDAINAQLPERYR
ncbi:ankyrin repeat domain-containing protein [Halomonadaceae bacterium KBTZ08]